MVKSEAETSQVNIPAFEQTIFQLVFIDQGTRFATIANSRSD